VSSSVRKLDVKDMHSNKKEEKFKEAFSFRVKLGEHEIELRGTRDDVLKTVEELPTLMTSVSKAFEPVQSKTFIVKASEARTESVIEAKKPVKTSSIISPLPFPTISKVSKCSEAILKLLESDWGRWRPRTLPELEEALKSNAIHYPTTTLSGVLSWLVRKGYIKRWKTEQGYVYILAEKGLK